MNNPTHLFQDAIRATGLEPPKYMEPGEFYRFPGLGKKNQNRAGWCKLFEDGTAGAFGDWSTDLNETWHMKPSKQLSPIEKDAFDQNVLASQKKAEETRQSNYDKASKNAFTIWNTSTKADNSHPYLVRKGIKANGARLHDSSLIIPLCSDNTVQSLQFITSDGRKRFLSGARTSGCYFSIGAIDGKHPLCIAEGFATAATLHQSTGYPAVVAFNANNLVAVAKILKEERPKLEIIICADDDAHTNGNPGIKKGTEAALSIGAKLALPLFGKSRPTDVSDFNDMAAISGPEAVAEAVSKAASPQQTSPNEWREPLPLTTKATPNQYPLDALPENLRMAVEEVLAFAKAPVPLVASSAIAALSLAAQAHADVKRAEKLRGPSSLFLLTIADSGERKSTCDSFFMQAIRDYEAEQSETGKPLVNDHNASMESWEAKRSGIKEKIRQLAKTGKVSLEQELALRDLEHSKPEPPRIPKLMYGDATPEALKWELAKHWPSGGVVSSEAGLVFGSHGMGKDSVMRNLATLNQLWDGAEISTERRSTESFTVRGARLTIALQVQEATLRSFFERSGDLARGTGFLARFLVAWPESTQGHRPFSDPPESWPALEKFNQRIAEILDKDAPIDENGTLTPRLLCLSPDTKKAWVTFHDTIEENLRSGGELYNIRDVASKIADNAARLATLFQIFEQRDSEIVEPSAFESASRIASWHLLEAQRFYGEIAIPLELENALHLDTWLLDYCRKEKTNIIPRREVQRNVTPRQLRQKSPLDAALAELEESDRLKLFQNGQRKLIHINPLLLDEASRHAG